MKIPQYTSQATPSSEAPGRSFSARMQTEPYVQAELQKGRVIGEALGQAAFYADTRYKMAREARLNDALLAADEQLRDETEALSKVPNLHSVLDGDNPLWNKNVDGIRKTLRATIGKDREALRAFDERFKQAEMSSRYKLRGVVDQKIKAQIALQRKRNLQNAEDNSVAANGIDEIFLNLSNAKVDGMRQASVLKANPDALEGQQGALIKNITARRIQKLLDTSENPIKVISALRAAAFDNDQSAIANLGKGVVEAELLSMIPASERANILRGGETLASYIDGPTLEEKAILEKKGSELSSLSKDVGNAGAMLEKNIDVSDVQIAGLEAQLSDLSATLPADKVEIVQSQIETLKNYKAFRQDVVALKTPAAMSELIDAMEGKEVKTPEDVAKIEFARKVFASTLKDIDEDVIAWAAKTNAAPVREIDLSFQNPDQSAAQLVNRAKVSQTLHDVTGRGDAGRPFQLLSLGEEKAFIAMFDEAPISQKMTTLMSMQQAFEGTGNEDILADLYQKISDKKPLMAHAGGLISLGREDAAREILQGLEQINAGVPYPKATGMAADGSRKTIEQVIAKDMQEALRFQPGATGAIIEATKAIIANRFVGVSEEELTEDQIKSAMQTAAGAQKRGNEIYGGIHIVNEAATFIPSDVTVNTFETIMDTLNPEILSAMGFRVNAAMWQQVVAGEWTFQVAGEGQYRVMRDRSVEGVPEYLNAYAIGVEGEPQVPLLIDFRKARVAVGNYQAAQVEKARLLVGANNLLFGQERADIAVDTAPNIPFKAVIAPDVPRPDSGEMIMGGQTAMATREKRDAQNSLEQLAADLATDKRAASNRTLAAQRQNKADMIGDLFSSVGMDATGAERRAYQEYMMKWLRDDRALDVLNFDDWKATQ